LTVASIDSGMVSCSMTAIMERLLALLANAVVRRGGAWARI
jgi:hypothetical protein